MSGDVVENPAANDGAATPPTGAPGGTAAGGSGAGTVPPESPTPSAAGAPSASTAATTATAEPAPEAPATDVWARAARRHRRRAMVLLFLNFALFSGLCIFTHWLHVGVPFQFSWDAYVAPARVWGESTQTLYDFVLFPISVDQTPIYGVVIGLLVASIVAVPICVAILYSLGSALPFVAAVFVFAHLPWMAVTLLGSCILAAVRPFRMNFRFGSALVALLPVVLYLYLATRNPSDALSASISPERKLLLMGPWLLAILAACTMLAVMIFLARLVNYRPGVVAPVMAVMFAAPAILFHVYIGVDELDYRVLEADYGPRSERFEPVQDATDTIRDFLHERTGRGFDSELQRAAVLALWSANPEEQLAFKHRISLQMLLDVMQDRQAACTACQRFIADHPGSRFIPCVLFIQGRVLDTRLDERKLIGRSAQRELYTDFPNVQSEPIWTNLVAGYPNSPLVVVGRLRLAQLRLRAGDAAGALAMLAPPAATPAVATQPGPRRLLRARPPEESLDFRPDDYLFEAQRLRELILANVDDPRYGTRPLQELACLDPHQPGYRLQLRRLADEFHDALLYDNLVVRWASAQPDREERAARLLACIERFPDGDALPEALFQRADHELQSQGAGAELLRARGTARMRELLARFPDSCWTRLATERLALLEPRTAPLSQPVYAP